MLLQLSNLLQKKGIRLRFAETLASGRDLLRKQGMEEIVGHISRRVSIYDAVQEFEAGKNGNAVQLLEGY
jgi:hypothetical protein